MNYDALQAVHKIFIGFNKRAERSSNEMLVASFVDSAPLFDLLSTTNNQVIYGRRGTGKTHALKFLADTIESRGEHPIYLDLRAVGSNGSVYADVERPVSERASTLLLDVLGGLYDELYRAALLNIDRHPNPEVLTRRLDALQMALSTIEIGRQVALETTDVSSRKEASGLTGSLTISTDPSVSASAKIGSEGQQSHTTKITRTGREGVYLAFGNISGALSSTFRISGGET
jgi:hypothetical protein